MTVSIALAAPPPNIRRGPIASEEQTHRALIDYLKIAAKPGVHWHHCPNGGHRAPKTAATLKAMGARAGIPDLTLIAGGKVTFLELKRERGGRLSPPQIAMHQELRNAGAAVITCQGFDSAVEALRMAGLCR